MKTEDLKSVIDAMSDGINRENIELYKKVIDGSPIKEFTTPEEFFYAVLYPWDNFIDGFLRSKIGNNDDLIFITKHSQFLEAHLDKLFWFNEGSACSHDKTCTIINSLLRFYSSGQRIEFNYGGEYTFHLPKKVLKTHEQIIAYYEGLKFLYYGDNRKYLEALKMMATAVA